VSPPSRVAGIIPYHDRPWDLLLLIVFSCVSAWSVVVGIYEPAIVGSHAIVYTQAASAWLVGGNPWSVGPSDVIFAGPPPMLVPFVPFVGLPGLLTRWLWVVGMAFLAMWTLKRLGLPRYWLVFPPIFQAVVLGHLEIGVLWLLVLGGPISGLAILVKPYAAAATLAERRWSAFALAFGLFIVSLAFLPWGSFIDQYGAIASRLEVQATGGVSSYGSPVLLVAAVVSLAALGVRRGLWLSVPLLWPNAQFLYKTATVPQLSPLIALFWAFPVPGVTLIGVLLEAGLRQSARFWTVPLWLQQGMTVAARPLAPRSVPPDSWPAEDRT
jgi:hypothetical protein